MVDAPYLTANERPFTAPRGPGLFSYAIDAVSLA